MKSEPGLANDFEAEVADRFGILPNFFRSAKAAPELIQQLWGFAKAGYLDNPMPSALIGNTDARVARLVQRLDRQTTAMTRMLDDLLDVSRIELGKVSVQTEPVPVQELLNQILEEQRGRIGQAGLGLEVHIEDEPCSASADRVRLRQVVDNLLSNAIKFTPAGGTIDVSFVKEGSCASISVRDTGVGFGEQFATKMFEPFTQEEQARDRPKGGLGLGLAISSRLATLQGGTLTGVSAGLNQGATFTLKLALAG